MAGQWQSASIPQMYCAGIPQSLHVLLVHAKHRVIQFTLNLFSRHSQANGSYFLCGFQSSLNARIHADVFCKYNFCALNLYLTYANAFSI